MADSSSDANNTGGGDGVIRPIEEESVRRIVAGQAVSDLASAVKELVDNALDAGAKSINIRLFNQGLDILEVSDDGSGVPPSSRPFLAQAHATSKIRTFEDIYNNSTAMSSLGFRGEALFCLANLSERLIVATRAADEDAMGQKMEFGHDGTLDPASVVAVPRKVGTTVAIVKLLSSLPVRRADLERRIVQHRSKLMRLMEAYAIFSVGVRINLMDVVDRKETTLLATTANSKKLDQTISSVLGSKFLASVAPISIDLTSALDIDDNAKGDWKLEGFLSKAPADQGNAGNVKAGQQFFSINGRPVELPKVARTIGDVWRTTMGGKKKYSCILTLSLPNQEYDVNLSPEKRQVLLTHEAAICEVIRTGVSEFWASQTEGQFTPSASSSQPAAAAAAAPAPAPAPSNNPHKPIIPKIDNMESLAKIQETNRKRALELHSQQPTVPSKKQNHEEEDIMDVDEHDHHDDDDDDDDDGDDDGNSAARRAYMRRFKQQQREQRQLNASGAADLYEDEEDTKAASSQEQAAAEGDPSPRLRRRGGFVHDISTAKQWERPSSIIDRNFKIPEGIEDPSDDEDEKEEAKEEGAPEKRRRIDPASPLPATAKTGAKEKGLDGGEANNDTTAKTNMEQCSSRRVTLSLNNELAEEHPASSTDSLPAMNLDNAASSKADNTHATASALPAQEEMSDGDKLLWMEAQARFNKREETIQDDVLLKSTVSQAYQKPRAGKTTATSSHVTTALNLEQFAFGKETVAVSAGSIDEVPAAAEDQPQQPAMSPEESAVGLSPNENIHRDEASSKRKRATSETNSQDQRSPGTGDSDSAVSLPRPVVWNFGGTEDIMEKVKFERMTGLERKESLKAARPGFSMAEDVETRKAKVSLTQGEFSFSVLGQFNLGFILATDPQNQLWILDQHAIDERANFEHLMATTKMHEQTLISPMPLELDPSEEACILDNREIFRMNGFRFEYNEDKPPRHRMSLTSLPHSGNHDGRKAVNFGPEDVPVLCSILGAGSGSVFEDDDADYASGSGGGTGADGSGMYGNNAVRRYARSSSQSQTPNDNADKMITRIPKAIAMFASRACRTSVMIGTALSKKEMEKLVKRLDDLNDPWKCAHGRPTMTHLADLQGDLLKDERKAAEQISEPTVGMSLTQPEVGDQ